MGKLLAKSGMFGKWVKKSGKSREFHTGKNVRNNTKYHLNKRVRYLELFFLSKKICHKISCKIGKEYVRESQEKVRNFLLARPKGAETQIIP